MRVEVVVTIRNSKWVIFFASWTALVVSLSSAPAIASNNLTVTVIREVEVFWNASPTLPVGKMPTRQMIQNGYKQFCKEYDYIGVSLASGKGWYFNNLSYIGKSSKAKWVKDKNGEDNLEAVLTCRNSVVFKSIPNSNWYTVKYAWRADAGTWWESHRITPGSLKKSKWGVTLRIDNDGLSKWSPTFTPEIPTFKSLGCSMRGDEEFVGLELTNPIHQTADSSFLGLRALLGYLPLSSMDKSELTELDLTDFTTSDDFRRGDDWNLSEELDTNLYIKKFNDGNFYTKVAFVVPISSYVESDFRFGPSLTRAGISEAFTYLLTLTPSCSVKEVVPIGKKT